MIVLNKTKLVLSQQPLLLPLLLLPLLVLFIDQLFQLDTQTVRNVSLLVLNMPRSLVLIASQDSNLIIWPVTVSQNNSQDNQVALTQHQPLRWPIQSIVLNPTTWLHALSATRSKSTFQDKWCMRKSVWSVEKDSSLVKKVDVTRCLLKEFLVLHNKMAAWRAWNSNLKSLTSQEWWNQSASNVLKVTQEATSMLPWEWKTNVNQIIIITATPLLWLMLTSIILLLSTNSL
jgi:hypothetical protein